MEPPGVARAAFNIEKDIMLEEYTCLYSDLNLEYQQAHSGPYEGLRYFGNDGVVIAAIQNDIITGFGRPVVAFGEPKTLRREAELLYDISHSIWYQDFLIDGELSAFSKFLLSKGAKAEPYYTQIIDLTKSEEELHAGVRKSYASLINARMPNVGVFSKRNCSDTRLNIGLGKLRDLYLLNVPNPRPEMTWNVQYDMLAADEAFLVADFESDEKCLAAAFFAHNSKTAYYFSGKSLDGHNSHAILWKAILHCKELGMRRIELGDQVLYGDPKQVGISAFKRGFGGTTQTYLHVRSF